ncbi:hypothetical protein [Cellulomonas timonensis]|uniref:hypothetical protein n=1 Tax=Cellulomonas timonensis TaxID=1689271 RepID=UPI0008304AFE|nr:hypothetical protein [Cellulomonas timonensis]
MTDTSTRELGGMLRRLRWRDDDSGSALVMVVGTMTVLAMLSLTVLAYTANSSRFARYNQDVTAAMAAAQAGIDDFISRVNRDDDYGKVVDCLNGAWRGPTSVVGHPCGWSTSTPVGWAPVTPGLVDAKDAAFHYSVDSSLRQSQGAFYLVVTGRVNGVHRSVEAQVGKGGSTDYVYYTDFESADPDNVQAYGANGASSVFCGKGGFRDASYWHSSNATDGKQSRSGKSCVEITFAANDELDGEVFTNDTIFATPSGSNKTLFKQQVYTGNPGCASAGATTNSWDTACLRSGSKANFNEIKPQTAAKKYLDDTSAAFATHPGCHYAGSTRVVFSADGRMKVWNKTSVNNGVEPVAIAAPGKSAPRCGTLPELDSTAGADLPVPDEMVIYVGGSTGAMRQCYAGELGGPSGQLLPVGTYSAAKASGPTSSGDTYRADANMMETTKMCGRGNLYAEGVLNGQVTISASESVIATGDLVLAGGWNGDDLLGLVATNSVEVFHPRIGDVKTTTSGGRRVWSTTIDGTGADVSGWPRRYRDPETASNRPSSGIQIAGSIQTLQHSFLVQKYDVGPAQGDLLVKGSIAQRWRGIVGRGTAGYIKDYRYDTRLTLSAPPYFPKWADSKYDLRYSGEIKTPDEVKG